MKLKNISLMISALILASLISGFQAGVASANPSAEPIDVSQPVKLTTILSNDQTPASAMRAGQWWTRGEPDLALTSEDIVFSPTSPTEGETVTIAATIHNIGEVSARSVKVGFYLGDPDAGGVLIDTDTIRWIRAGRSRDASVKWAAVTGTHEIYVVADPDGTISELDESNNVENKSIVVGVPEEYTLTFIVKDAEDKPISEALVTVNGHTGSTDGGTVSFTLLVGTYSYTVTKEGYETADGTIKLTDDTELTITLSPLPPVIIEYELFIEIDYMEGHEPTPEVLEYTHDYYYERGIEVTFYINDVVPFDPSITDDEFWAIEAAFNDLGDDALAIYDDPVFDTDGVYSSKWKWVLFGTTVEDQPNVVGYCYIVRQRVRWQWDLLAGNYMFIADETADDWATSEGIEPFGAEAVVLMHEMGHSIGIAKLDRRGREVYDPDPTSVMSYLSDSNAGLYWNWHYSDEYWATKNMEYYEIEA